MNVRHALLRVLGLCTLSVLTSFLLAPAADAAWLWDQNGNKLDDRMEAVETQGPLAARVGGVASGKLRFALLSASAPFTYGVYVGYDHHPTDADAAALAATGAPVQVRYENIDYIRSQVTLAQAVAIAARPGVTRVETIPALYPVNDIATQVLRARDSGGKLFPSVWANAGITGKGVSVAILDTGVNDEADGPYPGHESLKGKFLGGGSFFAGQPGLNTPLESSENPKHTLDPEATYHGTHVAGTAIGSGGPNGNLGGGAPGLYAGIAPDARLIDCKVLSDAGLGFGAADALDWLIHHKNDSWGLTGADSIYRGVDVANMSIGGTDNSDGTDAACAAVIAAARAGIVCCIATGNDGNTNWIASPCAADLAISVGAFSDNNTVAREDDGVTDYSNEGPRLPDGDSDQLDEMKPSVLGSGTGILSALGDPTTDGRKYHHINGTSMACPSVAGVCALIVQAHPGLSADDVRRILQDTADHRTDHGKQAPGTSDPYGIDPNYHPSWGWGQVDAYAAVKEAATPTATQVVRVQLLPERGPDAVRVRWTSQREINLSKYVVERAPDVVGGPGTFTKVHEAPAVAPRFQIHGLPNRRAYEYLDADPALVATATYWYRLRWIDQYGESHFEPALSVRIEDSPTVARVRYSWTHDYSDGDLAIRFGTGASTAAPAWFRAGLGAPAADSVVTRVGDPFTGTLQHYFHVDLTSDDLVAGYLPPSASNPWYLSVKEGGYVNTKGTVNDFSITWFGPGGPTTYAAPNPATPTVEKTETVFWIPLDPALSTNHAPVFQAVAPQSIGEGLLRRITVAATDADGDPLTYSATGLPAGASFDAGQRRFEWTPGFSAAGSYTVKFIASDAHFPLAAADTEVVALTVFDRLPGSNLAPAFDVLSDRSAIVGETITLRATARDPEGSALSYDSPHLPSGSSLDPATGAFAWTPSSAGDYRVTFVAHDPGGLTDSATVVLTALDATLGPAPPAACTESAQGFTGVAQMGIPEVGTTQVEIPFTAPSGIQRIEGTLTWFGGPAVDLDLLLLDADHNVLKSAASTNPSESLIYSTPEPGGYYWRVVTYASPDTAEFAIDMGQCVAEQLVGVTPDANAQVTFAPTVPNPFRVSTRVAFSLPRAGHVSLKLYDVAGRLVRTLENSELPAGSHSRVWDRKTDRGTMAMAGLYFYRLEADGKRLGQKVILAR
jgi:subtilisin family serine protease